MRLPLRHATAAAACALALLVSGCVLPDQIGEAQKDVADVQVALRRLQEQQAATTRQMEQLASRLERGDDDALTRQELADLTLSIEELSRRVAINDERFNDVDQRFDNLTRDVQQLRELLRRGMAQAPPSVTDRRPAGGDGPLIDDMDLGDSGAPGGTGMAGAGDDRFGQGGRGALPDAEQLYNSAYADFSKGNYDLAIAGFEEYQHLFPDSPQADNALYWIGECSFSQGSFDEAIKAYDKLLATYPSSDRAAAADLKKALAYLEQQQVGQAVVQLQYVIRSYPGTDEARIARDKLTSLGAS